MVIVRDRFKNDNRTLEAGISFVKNQARRLIKESQIPAPPFLPSLLAPFQGIKRIIREDLGNISGLLVPLRDGFEIKINATHSPQRQNFDCAHEIAHTFFFEEQGKVLLERIRRANGENSNWEEHLCDIAASELLMPRHVFYKYAAHYKFSVASLSQLSRIFDTAITPTAFKLCDTNPRWCFLVHWVRTDSEEINELRLRASWLTWSEKTPSEEMGRFLFNPKFLGQRSSIEKAYMSNTATFAKGQFSVCFFRGDCQILSQGFESGPNRYVMSFIFPEDVI